MDINVRCVRNKMRNKIIKGKVEIDLGMDNFCYIWTKNGRRVDLTEWMKRFSGKEIKLEITQTD